MPIKFRQLQKELGLSSQELTTFRKEKLGEDGYYRDEKGGAWFSDSAAEKLRIWTAVPLAVPSRYKGYVVRKAPNRRWVYAKGPNPELGLVPVLVGTKNYDRVLGKTIEIDVIKDADNGTTYRYAALGY